MSKLDHNFPSGWSLAEYHQYLHNHDEPLLPFTAHINTFNAYLRSGGEIDPVTIDRKKITEPITPNGLRTGNVTVGGRHWEELYEEERVSKGLSLERAVVSDVSQ